MRVIFNPAEVSYATLMKLFFDVAHDPTQLNRQGPDVGTQYRSAVFYTSDEQRAATVQYIAWLQQSGTIKGKIVTEVAPLSGFYIAAPYHQDYATLHPNEPYIRYNDLPKVAQLKERTRSSGATSERRTEHRTQRLASPGGRCAPCCLRRSTPTGALRMSERNKPHNGRDLDGQYKVKRADVDDLRTDPKGADYIEDDVRLGGAVEDTGADAGRRSERIADLVDTNREDVKRVTGRDEGSRRDAR